MTALRPDARIRRFAAVTVLAVACAALLATSQPPDESHLRASGQLLAELTGTAPRATGTLQIDLSAEALPEPAGELVAVGGTVRFQQPADQRETVVVTVEAPDLPIATRDELGETVVDLELMCRVAEPCSRQLRVTLEWLGARPGGTLMAGVDASVDVKYDGVQTNPEGATASVRVTEPMQPMAPGPEVKAQTPSEQLVLDAARWAAERHVVLTATAAAREGSVVAFLDRSIGQ